jgi:cytochrome c peroxidase
MSRGLAGALLLMAAYAGGSRAQDSAREAAGRYPAPYAPAATHYTDAALAPLPHRVALDPDKRRLGALLWNERRLSSDGAVACSSCHALDGGGADGRRYSTLPGRVRSAVNVPSVFNLAFNSRFGWSGRYEDIRDQLDAAMISPAAMASTWVHAADALAHDPVYVSLFERSYDDGLSPENVRDALAEVVAHHAEALQ